jgi:hypothetical protein
MKKTLNFIKQPLKSKVGGLSFEKISHYSSFHSSTYSFPEYAENISGIQDRDIGLTGNQQKTNVRPVWPELSVALFRKPKEGGEEAVFAASNGHKLAVPCIRSKYGF